MKARPKMSSLEAHLLTRRRLALARRPAQGQSQVANVMLEVEREVARLDRRILDLEERIARISDDQKPRRAGFAFRSWRVELVVSDRKQMCELVTTLKAWRSILVDQEGPRAIAAARTFAAHLEGALAEEQAGHDSDPTEPPIVPLLGPNGHKPGSGRWG